MTARRGQRRKRTSAKPPLVTPTVADLAFTILAVTLALQKGFDGAPFEITRVYAKQGSSTRVSLLITRRGKSVKVEFDTIPRLPTAAKQAVARALQSAKKLSADDFTLALTAAHARVDWATLFRGLVRHELVDPPPEGADT